MLSKRLRCVAVHSDLAAVLILKITMDRRAMVEITKDCRAMVKNYLGF